MPVCRSSAGCDNYTEKGTGKQTNEKSEPVKILSIACSFTGREAKKKDIGEEKLKKMTRLYQSSACSTAQKSR